MNWFKSNNLISRQHGLSGKPVFAMLLIVVPIVIVAAWLLIAPLGLANFAQAATSTPKKAETSLTSVLYNSVLRSSAFINTQANNLSNKISTKTVSAGGGAYIFTSNVLTGISESITSNFNIITKAVTDNMANWSKLMTPRTPVTVSNTVNNHLIPAANKTTGVKSSSTVNTNAKVKKATVAVTNKPNKTAKTSANPVATDGITAGNNSVRQASANSTSSIYLQTSDFIMKNFFTTGKVGASLVGDNFVSGTLAFAPGTIIDFSGTNVFNWPHTYSGGGTDFSIVPRKNVSETITGNWTFFNASINSLMADLATMSNLQVNGNSTTTGTVSIGSRLGLGGEYFGSLLGAGLINVSNTLSIATSTLGLPTFADLAGVSSSSSGSYLTYGYASTTYLQINAVSTTLWNNWYNASNTVAYLGNQNVFTATNTIENLLVNGRIGIGTTTPNNLLSIGSRNPTTATDRKAIEINAGGFSAPGAYNTNANGDKIILYRDAAANYDSTIGVGTASDLWFKSVGIGNGGSFKWFGGSSVTQYMTLDPSGHLGIGTTSPISTLSVKGTAGTNPLLVTSSTNEAMFTILQNGNVGIGTTSPGAKLEIDSPNNSTNQLLLKDFSGATSIIVDAYGQLTANHGFSINSSNGYNGTGILEITASAGTAIPLAIKANAAQTSSLLTITSSGGTQGNLFTVDKSGLVGIGTSSPAYTLSVKGAAGVNPFIIASSTGVSLLAVRSNGTVDIGTPIPANSGYALSINGTVYASSFDIANNLYLTPGKSINFDYNAADNSSIKETSNLSNDMIFSTDQVVRMYIAKSGNVGIGTTSPISTLSVKGTASTNPLTITSSTDASMFTILQNGNVGIGTASPGTKVDIRGVAAEWPDIRIYGDGANNSVLINANSIRSSGTFYINNSNTSNVVLGGGGGNIGIGTAVPTATLDVRSGNIPVQWGSTSTAYGQLNYSGGTATVLSVGATPIGFGVNSTVKLTIGSSGNVGIGTTTPDSPLQVFGVNASTGNSLKISGNLSMGGYDLAEDGLSRGLLNAKLYDSTGSFNGYIQYTTPGAIGPAILFRDTGGLNANRAYIQLQNSTKDLTFNVKDTERLRITNTGNVGIGTSSPVSTLSVKGIVGVNPFTVSSSSDASMFTILQNGNVGIGKATPAYMLDILSMDPTATNGQVINIGHNGSGGQASYAYFQSNGTNGGRVGWDGANGVFRIDALYSNNDIYIAPAGTGRTIIPNGNVGIGTTSPISTLSVKGTAGINPFAVSSSTDASMFTILQNGNVGIGVAIPAAKLDVNGSIYVHGGTFYSDNWAGYSTNLIKINGGGTGLNAQLQATGNGSDITNFVLNPNGGLVGIGTTSPISTLSVKGTAGINPFTVSSSTNDSMFTILQNGNVGIGTASPQLPLAVVGDAYVTNNVKTRGIDSAWIGSTQNISVTSGATGYANINNALYVQTGGNVGIGTASPANPLSLVYSDNLYLRGISIKNISTGTTAITGIQLQNSAGVGVGNFEYYPSNYANGAMADKIIFSTLGTTASLLFNTNISGAANATSGDISFNIAGGNPSIFIKGSDGSGKVGVGTNNPNQTLDVYKSGQNYPNSSGVIQNGAFRIENNFNNVLDFGNISGTTYQSWIQATDKTNLAISYSLLLNPNGGNIGIGTTSPASTLSVKGIAGTNLLTITSSTDASMFTILQNGNVGIGTANPSNALDVTGNIRATGQLIANGGGMTLNAGNVYYASGINLQYWTGVVTTGLALTNTGLVGIGTTTPTAKLVVQGSSTTPLLSVMTSSSAPVLYVSDAGFVGIGTSSPSQKLDVAGNIALSTGGSIFGDTTAQKISLNSSLGNVWAYDANNYMRFGSIFQFYTGGTERFRLDNSGNVGIGTTTPGSKLQVEAGQLRVTNVATGGVLATAVNTGGILLDSVASQQGIEFALGDSGSGYGYRQRAYYDSGQSSMVWTLEKRNNSASFSSALSVLSSNGNVGIGTTSPQSALFIQSTNVNDVPRADIVLAKYWASNSDTRASAIFHYYDSIQGMDKLVFGVAGSGGTTSQPNALSQAKLVVQANGAVGIGTSSPIAKLDVHQAAGGLAPASLANFYGSGSGLDSKITIQSNSNSYGQLQIGGVGKEVSLAYISGVTAFGTSPTSNLGSAGIINQGLGLYSDTGDIYSIASDARTGGAGPIFRVKTSGYGSMMGAVDTNYVWKVYGDNRVTGNSIIDGNVGIGSSTPVAKLVVQGTSTTPLLSVMTSSSVQALYVSDVGNMGIGMTPTYKLDVNGTIRANGSNIIAGGGTVFGWIFGSSGLSNIDTTLNTTAGYNILFKNGTTEQMRISSSGLVGIGSSSPISTLSVKGTAGYNPLTITSSTDASMFTILQNGNVGIGTNNPTDLLQIHSATTNARYRLTDSTTGPGVNRGLSVELAGVNGWVVNYENGPLYFSTNNTTAMSILANGNVGIGTTTPGYALTVNGNVNTSGFSLTNTIGTTNWFVERGGTGGNNFYWKDKDGNYYITLDMTGDMGYGSRAIALRQRLVTYTDTALAINSGNVGIGTVSPSAKLEVVGGSLKVSGGNSILLDASSGINRGISFLDSSTYDNIGSLSIYPSSGTNVKSSISIIPKGTGYNSTNKADISIYNTDQVADGTNIEFLSVRSRGNNYAIYSEQGGSGSRRPITLGADSSKESTVQFVLNTDGNIGIGTSSPAAKLEVNGNVLLPFVGSLQFRQQSGAIIPAVSMNANGAIDLSSINSFSFNNGTSIQQNNPTNYSMAFLTGSTPVVNMVIKDAGNVGIGTTTPTAKLVVQGTSTTPLLSVMTSSSAPALYVSDAGNVGIGTSNPLGQFEVLNAGSRVQLNGSLGSIVAYTYGGGGAGGHISSFEVGGLNSAAILRMYDSTQTQQVQIWGAGNSYFNGGNVGIGTTTPASKLHVAGSSDIKQLIVQGVSGQTANLQEWQNASGTAISAIDNTGFFRFPDTGSGGGFKGLNNPSKSLYIDNGSGQGVWNAYNSILFNVFSNNPNSGTNYGLGYGFSNIMNGSSGIQYGVVIRPTYLQSGTAGATDLLINRTETSVGSGPQLLFDAQVGGNSKMVITNQGNVGIGSSTPFAKLVVQGTSTTPLLSVMTSSSVSALYVSDSGYVGIGTSNPTNIFEVDVGGISKVAVNGGGTLIAKSDIVTGLIGDLGSKYQKIMLDQANGLRFFAGSSASNEYMKISQTGLIGIGTTSPDSLLTLFGPSNNANLLSIYTSSSFPVLYVTSAGYVGIGTTTPAYPLTVNGVASFDSFLANSAVSTSTIAGGLSVGNGSLTYDWNSGVTSIDNLQTGAMSFVADAGLVSWADMTVTTSSVAGTQLSYIAQLNGNYALSVSGISDGNGDLSSYGVGIGTSTASALLTLQNASTTSLQPIIGAYTASGSPALYVSAGGNVGIGTTNPVGTFNTEAATGWYNKDGSKPTWNMSYSGTTVMKLYFGGLWDAYLDVPYSNNDDTWGGFHIKTKGLERLTIAQGGNVGIGTTTPNAYLNVFGSSSASTLLRVATSTNQNIFVVNSNGNVSLGTSSATYLLTLSGGAYSDGLQWYPVSDKNAKENFAEVDPNDILNKINNLPVTRWNYKAQGMDNSHIGPMAQDFYGAFGLGNNDKVISTMDLASVALTGVKALSQRLSVLENPTSSSVALAVATPNANSLVSLTVTQSANFFGAITVRGEAGFESKVVFKKEVEFQDHLTVDADTAGMTVIKTGETKIEVKFVRPYSIVPAVVANLQASDTPVFVDYLIRYKSTSSFWIMLKEPAPSDLNFDWIALGRGGNGIVAGATETAVAGCLDASATNYNASATIDDGTCAYASSPVTPPMPEPTSTEPVIDLSSLFPVVEPEVTPVTSTEEGL